jgi:hypothetical protein
MKMKRIVSTIAIALMASVTIAAEAEFKSGLQVGDYPGAFYVTDVTGPSAGEALCYRCQYGSRPVVSIFARSMDDNVKQLVKQIDTLVGEKADDRLAAFVVLLSDEPKELETALKTAATEGKITHTPLTTYKKAGGPRKYRIHEDADITVVMWVENDVKVNHTFAKGKLTPDAIAKVVSDTSMILN